MEVPPFPLSLTPHKHRDSTTRLCSCHDECAFALVPCFGCLSCFKHILSFSPAGAFTEYFNRAPIGSVLPARTAAQRSRRDLLVVVLHLLSTPSCCRDVAASWTDVAVPLVAGIGGPDAEVAEWVSRP